MATARVPRWLLGGVLGLAVVVGLLGVVGVPALDGSPSGRAGPDVVGSSRVVTIASPAVATVDRFHRVRPPILGWMGASAALAVVIAVSGRPAPRPRAPHLVPVRTGRHGRAPPR